MMPSQYGWHDKANQPPFLACGHQRQAARSLPCFTVLLWVLMPEDLARCRTLPHALDPLLLSFQNVTEQPAPAAPQRDLVGSAKPPVPVSVSRDSSASLCLSHLHFLFLLRSDWKLAAAVCCVCSRRYCCKWQMPLAWRLSNGVFQRQLTNHSTRWWACYLPDTNGMSV